MKKRHIKFCPLLSNEGDCICTDELINTIKAAAKLPRMADEEVGRIMKELGKRI